MQNPRWATKDEAAQHIGVSVFTIDRWVKAGRLTAYRLGGRLVRFDLNQIDELILAATATPNGEAS